jgi:hypothetical protein
LLPSAEAEGSQPPRGSFSVFAQTLKAVEGDGLQAVRYNRKTIAALASEGRSLSWKDFPQRLKPIHIARVMYELKLVPFIPYQR